MANNIQQKSNSGKQQFAASETLYHYVIVRSDLPTGAQFAQAVHAAGESVRERVPDGTHAVVLSVPNEEALLSIAESLWKNGFANDEYTVIVEPDLPDTGHAYAGQFTAIGLRPSSDRERIGKVLGRLPLLK